MFFLKGSLFCREKGHFIRHKLFLSAFIALNFLLYAVSGSAKIELQSEYNVSKERLIVSGSISEPYGLVTLLVIPASEKIDNLTADIMDIERYAVRTVRSDENGTYTASLTMPDWAESGRYCVYVSDSLETAQYEFTHFNTLIANEALERINSADKAEMSVILKEEATSLALDDDIMELYGEEFADGIYKARPKTGYTINGLMIELNRIYALCMVQSGDVNDAETVMKSYAGNFDMDYSGEYQGLEDRVKNVFVAQVKAGDFTESIAYDIFYESMIYAVVTESSYIDVQSAVEKYSDYMQLDMTDYNKLSSYKQSKVISGIMQSTLKDYDAIKPLFEKLADEVYGDNVSSSSGGFNGGGSGGYYGGGTQSDSFSEYTSAADTLKEPQSVVPFVDMTGHWAKDIVESLTEKGIVSGFTDGSYKPENQVTRAEFAKLMVSALELGQGSRIGFGDVSVNDWYYPYVCAAQEAGLIQGHDGNFRPDDAITREECAAILYRALKHSGIDISGGCSFADNDSVAEWARNAVGALEEAGLLKGYENRFMPKNNTTRAEAASMIYNLLLYTERC